MDFSTMILSIGTALRRAQDARAPVKVLVGGVWLSGYVAGVDGEGALLASPNGESTIVRLQGITAVHVGQSARAPAPDGPLPDGPLPVARRHAAYAR